MLPHLSKILHTPVDLNVSFLTLFQLPMLVPQLNYKFETIVESLDDFGRAEDIKVFVLKRGNPNPLITAVINMPLSENVIVV